MATISTVNGKKITKIKYKGEIYDTGGGSSGGNTLKALLDATKSSSYLFYQYEGTNIDGLISYGDTSNVTNMNSMFWKCSNLITIPQLDTSNVTNMNYMFRECRNLTAFPQLDTSKVTTMLYMFYQCENNLTTIKLDTRNVTNMSYMFRECRNLKTIDITHMNITQTYNNSEFAYSCNSLTKLIIRNMSTIPALNSDAFNYCYHFIGTTNATYNPQGLKDGRIYVPDDKVEELKTATNWSVFADIIVPLSTLVE